MELSIRSKSWRKLAGAGLVAACLIAGPALAAAPASAAPATMPTAPASYIGINQAKEIALADAGLSASNVWIVKSVGYQKNRTYVYDIIFMTTTTKHFYLIDASSGAITFRQVININGSGSNNGGSGGGSGSGSTGGSNGSGEVVATISESDARDIALAQSGIAANLIYQFQSEYNQRKNLYQIEIDADGWQAEYDIDAATGAVLDSDKDRQTNKNKTAGMAVTESQARATALAHSGIAPATVTQYQAELDSKKKVYEIEIKAGNSKVVYKISAANGTITSVK